MKLATVILALVGSGLSATPGRPSIIAHTGKPVGREVVHDNVTYYVTGKKTDTAVLYLTDVFGIQLNQNKLLADSFGRAGYLTIAPDLFNGTPAPEDIVGTPSFNVTEFLYAHRPEVTDPLLAKALSFIRHTLRVDTVVTTGYCFGGRHAFRLLSSANQSVAAGFAAHPSLLEDDEILDIAGPVSVAAAETDQTLDAGRRAVVERLLRETGEAYSLALYGGTNHGFAVRGNVSDVRQKFGKEEAFWQAVAWFDYWT